MNPKIVVGVIQSNGVLFLFHTQFTKKYIFYLNKRRKTTIAGGIDDNYLGCGCCCCCVWVPLKRNIFQRSNYNDNNKFIWNTLGRYFSSDVFLLFYSEFLNFFILFSCCCCCNLFRLFHFFPLYSHWWVNCTHTPGNSTCYSISIRLLLILHNQKPTFPSDSDYYVFCIRLNGGKYLFLLFVSFFAFLLFSFSFGGFTGEKQYHVFLVLAVGGKKT